MDTRMEVAPFGIRTAPCLQRREAGLAALFSGRLQVGNTQNLGLPRGILLPVLAGL